MEQRWETLARADAEFYIWPNVAKGEDFFASGERDCARILRISEPFIADWRLALEIGCGVGRIAMPMAGRFERLIAVDVAPTMLQKLRANCAARGLENVLPFLSSDAWDAVGPVDFAYSQIVLQHIQDWAEIERYFQRVSASLGPRGAFYAHFDTRPSGLLYGIKTMLPDPLLPRLWRRGARRIRRTSEQVRKLAASCGLGLVHEEGAGTADSVFVLRRS